MSENAFTKSLTKKYGDVITPANLLVEREKKVFPVSPSLDVGFTGGIPEGSWWLISGPKKCGKTTTALQFLANCMKLAPERPIWYFNIEGRLKKMNLEGIDGLDPSVINVVESTKGNIITGDRFLTIAADIMRNTEKPILVLDSISALCPSDRFGEDISGSTRSSTPKMLSDFCKQMAGVVPVQDVIIVCIQHLIANTSGMGRKWIEDGGVKIGFQADVKMKCKYFEKWMENDKHIGNILHWDIETSALGSPKDNIDSYVRFGYGIDKVKEISMLATDIGLIDKKGAWYTISCVESEEKPKMQGQEKLCAYLRENQDVTELLYDEIRSIL